MALWSCNSADDEEVIMNNGTASALLNGEVWEMVPAAAYSPNCQSGQPTLYITISMGDEYLLEYLSIHNISLPVRLGTYSKMNSSLRCNSKDSLSVHYYTLVELDQPAKVFDIVEEADNVLTITEYDSLNRTVSGTFKMTLASDKPSRLLPNYPDTVRITNGQFSVAIDPMRE